MAWVLSVDSVDIIHYVDIETVLVEEVATQELARVGVLRFTAHDHTATIAIEVEAAVVMTVDGTTVYSGKIKEMYEWTEGVTRYWRVTCADQNVLLEETGIDSYTIDTYDDDDVEIAAIFAAFRADVDATTYVTQLDTTMPGLVLDGYTLREALDAICAHTGGRYYVDFDKALHYFDSEGNSAAFSLSDSPDGESSFGYEGFRPTISSTRIAKRFFILGQGVSGWVTGGSYSAGDPEGVNRDNRITTEAGRDKRGTQLLDRYEDAQISYELYTRKDGLSAGMDVTLVNAPRSIDASFTIRRIVWTFEDKAGDRRLYHLWLNDEPADAAARTYTVQERLNTLEQGANQTGETVFDTNAPAAPAFTAGNLTTGVIEDADGHQIVWIRATWGSVADADLDHYEVQLADNDAFNWPNVGLIQAGETREYQWNGLRGSTTYYARVRAVDWVGNYSAWSPASPGYLSVTSSADSTPPAQVAGATAAGARTLIGVTWNANSEADLGYYEIQRDNDNGGAPAGAWATVATLKTTFYLDEDHSEAAIQAGTTYHYRIRAVDTSGNEGDYSSSTSASLSPIGSDTIAASAVIAGKIAAGAVVAGKIAADAVDTAQLVAGAVTATKMDVSTLSAITADMGTLTAGEIRVGAGTVGVDFTGFRIFSSYIAGYNNDVPQFYVDSADGKAYAAAGAIRLDDDGITVSVETGAAYADIKSYRMDDGAGTVVGRLTGYVGDPEDSYVALWAHADYGGDTYLHFFSDCDEDGHTAEIELKLLRLGSQFGTGSFIRMHAATNWASVWSAFDSEFSYNRFENGVAIGSLSATPAIGTLEVANVVLINETINAQMTQGITINQGASDDEILALKSSDVAHGATDFAETDTYGLMQKAHATGGGLALYGFRDADGAADQALQLAGHLAENVNTAKDTSGRGIVAIWGWQTSGAGRANTVANGNVLTIGTQRGGDNVAVVIVDEDGDIYHDGTTAPYDAYDDALMAGDLARVMSGQYNKIVEHNRGALEAAGIIGPQDDHGRFMVSTKGVTALTLGALGQLWERCQRYERALARIDPRLLEEAVTG